MTLVLDAGALIAYDRGSPVVQAFLERAARSGDPVRTTTGVVAQVWRDGARQAKLALLLRGIEEVELTRDQARRVGALLGHARSADVIDGSIVDVARDGDEVLTGDPDDIVALAEATGRMLIVTRV